MKRLGRTVAGIAKTLGLLVVFIVSLAGAVLLHLGLSVPRELVRTRVNELLAATFHGEVRVDAVASIRLGELEGIEATVLDPDGKRAAWVAGGRARIDLRTLVRSLVGQDALAIVIPEIEVDAAEVVLDVDPDGNLGIARAFELRDTEPSEPGRPTSVELQSVRVRHAWVHGDALGGRTLDADVDGLVASLRSDTDGTLIALDGVAVSARGNPGLDPRGVASGSLMVPADASDELSASGAFVGWAGEIAVSLEGSLRGEAVSASIVVDEASPEALSQIDPAIQLASTVRARAEIEGELPVLYARAEVDAGGAVATVDGAVVMPGAADDPIVAWLGLRADALDLSVLAPSAPPSRLSLDLAAAAAIGPGARVRGLFAVRHHPGALAGNALPAAQLVGSFHQDGGRVRGLVAEPGVPVSLEATVAPLGPHHLLTFTASSDVRELRGITRVEPIGRGRAELAVEGTLVLETLDLDAAARARLWDLDAGGVQAAYVGVEADVHGRIPAAALEATVDARAIRAADRTLVAARAQVSGTLERLVVHAEATGGDRTPSGRLDATVTTTPAPRADDVRLVLSRAGVETVTTIGAVYPQGGGVVVQRARIEGLGEPLTADARIGGRSIALEARTEGVDIARLTRLVAYERDVRGRIALDVDIEGSAVRARGRARVAASGLTFDGNGPGGLDLDVRIDGRTLRGELALGLDGAGEASVTAMPITLGGPLFDPSSWERAVGIVDVKSDLDLAAALARVPEGGRGATAPTSSPTWICRS